MSLALAKCPALGKMCKVRGRKNHYTVGCRGKRIKGQMIVREHCDSEEDETIHRPKIRA